MIDYFLVLSTSGHTLVYKTFLPNQSHHLSIINDYISHLLVSPSVSNLTIGPHRIYGHLNPQSHYLLILSSPSVIDAPYAPSLLRNLDQFIHNAFSVLDPNSSYQILSLGLIPSSLHDSILLTFSQLLIQFDSSSTTTPN